VSEEEREEIELTAIDPAGGLDDLLIFGSPATRRRFLKQVAGTGAATGLGPGLMSIGSVDAAETAPGGTRAPSSSA
jgi:hypothetical protein